MLVNRNLVPKMENSKVITAESNLNRLPQSLMNQNLVPRIIEIPLGTAANEQSLIKGKGFVKCGCVKSCQVNNCKCKNLNKYLIPEVIKEACMSKL